MGVLDTVLRYKNQKDAERNADISAIPQAMMQFQAGRQQATDNLLKQLALQATLASSGLRISQGPNGLQIARDESLVSPMDQLIQRGKAAEAAKNVGDRSLFNALQSNPSSPQATQGLVQPSNGSPVSQMQAPEIDPFTGKPTTKGIQQEAINKQIQAQGLEEAKTGAKNKEKIKGMETIEGDLDSLLALYNKIPSHDKGPLEGRTRGVYAKAFGTDVPLTTFEDSSGLVLANISREFGGEKGVLTDQDIKRIKSAFPNKTDTDAIAQSKIAFIKDFVRRKIDVKRNGSSSKIDLSSMSTEELKKLAGV